MSCRIEKLLENLPSPMPSAGLYQKTLTRIGKERRQLAQNRILAVLGMFGIMASGAGIVLVGFLLWRQLSGSGFLDIASLALSDYSAVASYWQVFTVSLLESLPVLSLIVFFGLLVTFLESLRLFAKEYRPAFKPAITN